MHLIIGILFIVVIIASFLFLMKLISNAGKKIAMNDIDESIRRELAREPRYRTITEEERKKYRGSTWIIGLVIFAIFPILLTLMHFVDHGEFRFLFYLVVSSPIGIIILALCMRDTFRFRKGRTIYAVRAYCTLRTHYHNALCSFVYYDFMYASYESESLSVSGRPRTKNIDKGQYFEVLVTPTNTGLKFIDFA